MRYSRSSTDKTEYTKIVSHSAALPEEAKRAEIHLALLYHHHSKITYFIITDFHNLIQTYYVFIRRFKTIGL